MESLLTKISPAQRKTKGYSDLLHARKREVCDNRLCSVREGIARSVPLDKVFSKGKEHEIVSLRRLLRSF